MRLTTFAVAAAILTLSAAPAFAQDAAVATATPDASVEAESAASPDETAFEARAEAFGQGIATMAEEMQAAIAAAGADTAKKTADLDAIQSRYQSSADAFAADLQAFVAAQAATKPAEEAAEMTEGLDGALVQIRGVPALVRAQVEQAATAAPAAPAAE